MLNASLFTVWLCNFFNVGSLFKLLFAYNTFVPFSFTQGFTGESSSIMYYTSHVGLRCDNTTSFTATRYPPFQDGNTLSVKHDNLHTGCIY